MVGFQPLNHNKRKCELFPNHNHVVTAGTWSYPRSRFQVDGWEGTSYLQKDGRGLENGNRAAGSQARTRGLPRQGHSVAHSFSTLNCWLRTLLRIDLLCLKLNTHRVSAISEFMTSSTGYPNLGRHLAAVCSSLFRPVGFEISDVYHLDA